ncbi:MAG TPA: hypothetical protein VME43_28730 [Bryobacteraceae bacterium]|nr:hypothetical protein [Bryobacteraceae bacterium]
MFDPPKGRWEILASWRATPKDRRFDLLDRTPLEEFLRLYRFDLRIMSEMRQILTSTDPVSRFTDDEVIDTIAWRLATKELVIRQPDFQVTSPSSGGGGGDESDDQQTKKNDASVADANAKTGPPAAKTKAPKPKHWIGVKVVDQDGKPVKDVTVNGEFNDGASFSVDFSSATLQPDGSYKTETIYDGTTCDFTFPSLYDVEWWPQGGAADPASSVIGAPPVASGDCLLSIADSLSFRNYHSIWDQSQNAALKKNRPNPNMLALGDVVKAPNKKVKLVHKNVDQTWTFVVRSRKPFKVRLVLIDRNNAPLSGKKWELKAPTAQNGTTAADGLIELTVLKPGDKSGSLEVTMKDATAAPAQPAPAPAPPANPPPYPPVIVATDYKDKMPAPDFKAQVETWDLHVGGLPPVKTPQGTLARLHNLGFGCDIGSDAAKVTRAVKAYQLFYQKNAKGSGKTADIQDDAGTRHDN